MLGCLAASHGRVNEQSETHGFPGRGTSLALGCLAASHGPVNEQRETDGFPP